MIAFKIRDCDICNKQVKYLKIGFNIFSLSYYAIMYKCKNCGNEFKFEKYKKIKNGDKKNGNTRKHKS